MKDVYKSLIRICPQCGSGDVDWCFISLRPYCNECNYWAPVNNHGDIAYSITKWNKSIGIDGELLDSIISNSKKNNDLVPIEKVAIIDMDGTIVDYHGYVKKNLEQFSSSSNYYKMKNNLKNINGFWNRLSPLNEGFLIMQILKEYGFKLHIVSKGSFDAINSWKEKVEWCRENLRKDFGKIGKDYQISITSDKSRFYGQILFDDYIPYCEAWLKNNPNGLVIQLENEHNIDWKNKNVIKYNIEKNNLKEVINGIERISESLKN